MREIIQQLRPGDHVALFYQSGGAVCRGDSIHPNRPRPKERCLYIVGDTSVPMVIAAMEEAGIDVARAEREGQLTVATPDQTYLRHGPFEPEKMVEGLMQEIESTLSQGYSVFRGTGELGWASTLPSVLLRLYEYEQRLDEKVGSAFIALCQYNETLFTAELLGQMLRVHPKVLARGRLFENPFYLRDTPQIVNFPPVTMEHLVTRRPVAAEEIKCKHA